MAAAGDLTDLSQAPDLVGLEQFLFHEARLLDEQRWQEWSDLFVEEGEYWVPASPDQADAINHVSLTDYKNLVISYLGCFDAVSTNALTIQQQLSI